MTKFLVYFCSLISYSAFAQDFISKEFTPVKSPEVTSFVNANFVPLDEFSGKENINIPLYSIDLDGLEIPISLSYDTGGIKVNTVSSNVGLNWSLNAGGLINKEVVGGEDTQVSVTPSDVSGTGYAYSEYGFLRDLFTWPSITNHPIIASLRDKQPDIYHVYAPGLNTDFIHKSDGTPLEVKFNNNIIYSPFTNSQFLNNPFYRLKFIEKVNFNFGFKIVSNQGFEYSFYDVGLIANGIRSSKDLMAYQYVAWSTNITEDTVETKTFQPAVAGGNDVAHSSWDLFPTIHLSKIKNPTTKREVEFIYENNSIVDSNRFSEIKYNSDLVNDSEVIYHEHDYAKEKILKKIIFPDGFIDFYYESNRLDSRGGKILKKIEIRNNYGNFIKGITFEQNYTSSISGCTDDLYCRKLLLNSISFFDQNNNKLPGYSFTYNTSPLPRRYSLDQDFLGFYNGSSGVSDAYNVPKIYFKANQGKISYIPFPFSDYVILANGNADKTPNLSYGKASSLEKITYPTGGYTLFEYELHSFDFLGSTINCGGLRIKSESIFDKSNNLQKKINYNYNKDNGITSGRIVNLPNFVIQTNANDYYTRIYQSYNNKLESNNSSAYVGYSQVKISEDGNGYKINTYSNELDFPNIYPTTYTLSDYNSTYSSYYNSFISKYNNGLASTIFKDFSSRRGNLISSKIFNNNNLLIKSISNEYDYKIYNQYAVSQIVCVYKGHSFYSLTPGAYATFNSTIDIQSNQLKKNNYK